MVFFYASYRKKPYFLSGLVPYIYPQLQADLPLILLMQHAQSQGGQVFLVEIGVISIQGATNED